MSANLKACDADCIGGVDTFVTYEFKMVHLLGLNISVMGMERESPSKSACRSGHRKMIIERGGILKHEELENREQVNDSPYFTGPS